MECGGILGKKLYMDFKNEFYQDKKKIRHNFQEVQVSMYMIASGKEKKGGEGG